MIVVLAVLGRSAAYSNTFTVPGTDSTTALNLLTKDDMHRLPVAR